MSRPSATGPTGATGTSQSAAEQVRGWRHDLHRIPETAFAEHETSAYVADVLRRLGFDVVTGVGGTGVVGSLTRGGSPRAVALRAELDALPITEASGVPYASQHPGAMHACGHDGHLAMALGAAARLGRVSPFMAAPTTPTTRAGFVADAS